MKDKTISKVSTCLEKSHVNGFIKEIFTIIKSCFWLMKPGIVLLVTVTGLVAMVVEKSLIAYPLRFCGILLGIALSAGSANAINQVYDRDIDAIMDRTKAKRPIPAGLISPECALGFSAVSGITSLLLFKMAGNTLTAILGLTAILWYVFLYTMWLKRRTSLNVVIGGVAGAIPPLIGWSAGAGQLSVSSLLMFLIIFLWSPPHFWALALYRKEEYKRAGIPMLPVIAGEKNTRMHITIYSTLLLLSTFYFGIHANYTWIFFCGTILMGIGLAYNLFLLLLKKDALSARKLFRFSIIYLTVIFSLIFTHHKV